MRQIVADERSGAPIIRIRCPDCGATLERTYAIDHGRRIECDDCHSHILFTFELEVVNP